jgi:outer membrane protein assembly factor BamB
MDIIIQAAEANGIKVAVCTCSGPWFTWPINPNDLNPALTSGDFGQPWVQRQYQRSLRYHIARWGSSTAVFAWELHNEWGHINPTNTPDQYTLVGNLNTYLANTDPYGHLRTTSQNQQAFSPQFWSQDGNDIANTHTYADATWGTTLQNDEAQLIMRQAWCLSATNSNPAMNPICSGLGYGDGTSWPMGAAMKPWMWGETGIGSAGTQCQAQPTNEPCNAVFLHNKTWAALFNPLVDTPLEWWWYNEDTPSTNAKYAATKAASNFFYGLPIDALNFTFLMTSGDRPPSGYSGPTMTSSNAAVRSYGMRSADLSTALWWVQNKNNRVGLGPNTVAANATITMPGLAASRVYEVEQWDTYAGTITTRSAVTTDGSGNLLVSVTTATDVAFKATLSAWPQFQKTSARTGRTMVTMAPTYGMKWFWMDRTHTYASIPFGVPVGGGATYDWSSGGSTISLSTRMQPVFANGKVYIGTLEGNAYAINESTGATSWGPIAIAGGTAVTAAVVGNIVVYATLSGIVYGLNASTGAQVWSYDTGYSITTSPCVEINRVFVATHHGDVVAFDGPTGKLLWSARPTTVPIVGEIASDVAGVYVPADDMFVYALNPVTGALTATSPRLRGQSFRGTNPVVFAGKVWVTSSMGPGGSLNAFETGNPLHALDGATTQAQENTLIQNYLNSDATNAPDASGDWRHYFALNLPGLGEAFTILAGPTEGTGNPPDSMVVDNTDRVLAYFKTKFPTLTHALGGQFGTIYTLDIAAINQTTGVKIPIGAADGSQIMNPPMYPWETDNLFHLSVGGNVLFVHQRFRGTQAIDFGFTPPLNRRIQTNLRDEDGSGDNVVSGYAIVYCNVPTAGVPTYACTDTSTPPARRPKTNQTPLLGWAPVSIAQKWGYVTEPFGVLAFCGNFSGGVCQ